MRPSLCLRRSSCLAEHPSLPEGLMDISGQSLCRFPRKEDDAGPAGNSGVVYWLARHHV